MPFLLLLLIWPFAELAVLIHVAGAIGVLKTIGLCILGALAGGWLMQWQGMITAVSLRQSLIDGKMPVEEMYDGICVFIAGILLILPGFISDAMGLMLLWPAARHVFRNLASRYLKGEPIVPRSGPPAPGMAIDAEYTRLDDRGEPLLKSDPHNKQE